MLLAERRYVLLRHECPADYRDGPHWDLMLEDGDTLRTWSLLSLPYAWRDPPPSAAMRKLRRRPVSATELPPHRLAYLEYEGEISGDRGSVARVAEGVFEWLVDEPKRVVLEATTGRLQGVWRLEQIGPEWRLNVE
ncbi:MAG: hypothetical protein AAF596_01785 [Planctomycetota bacterium]